MKANSKASAKYNQENYERVEFKVVKGDKAKIKACADERPQNIDDDLEDMLDSYGYYGDELEDEMRMNGVSWSDFI